MYCLSISFPVDSPFSHHCPRLRPPHFSILTLVKGSSLDPPLWYLPLQTHPPLVSSLKWQSDVVTSKLRTMAFADPVGMSLPLAWQNLLLLKLFYIRDVLKKTLAPHHYIPKIKDISLKNNNTMITSNKINRNSLILSDSQSISRFSWMYS